MKQDSKKPFKKTVTAWLAAAAGATQLFIAAHPAVAQMSIGELADQTPHPQKQVLTLHSLNTMQQTAGFLKEYNGCRLVVVDGQDLVEHYKKALIGQIPSDTSPTREAARYFFEQANFEPAAADVNSVERFFSIRGSGITQNTSSGVCDGENPIIIGTLANRHDGIGSARQLLDYDTKPEAYKGIDVEKIDIDYKALTADASNAFGNYHEEGHTLQVNYTSNDSMLGQTEAFIKIPKINAANAGHAVDPDDPGLNYLIMVHINESASDVFATLRAAASGFSQTAKETAKIRLIGGMLLSKTTVSDDERDELIAYNSYNPMMKTIELVDNIAAQKWPLVEKSLLGAFASYQAMESRFPVKETINPRHLIDKIKQPGGLSNLNFMDIQAISALMTSAHCMSPKELLDYKDFITMGSLPSADPKSKQMIEGQAKVCQAILNKGITVNNTVTSNRKSYNGPDTKL